MENIINPPTKFTQEIKDKWLDALKSGKYTQGFMKLEYYDVINGKETLCHCCLGVLQEIIKTDPYAFINASPNDSYSIWEANDKEFVRDYNANKDGCILPRDYSNVIPLIESLTVTE